MTAKTAPEAFQTLPRVRVIFVTLCAIECGINLAEE
jgi:hypothetical protein